MSENLKLVLFIEAVNIDCHSASYAIAESLDELLKDKDFRNGVVGKKDWSFKPLKTCEVRVNITQEYDDIDYLTIVNKLNRTGGFRQQIAKTVLYLALLISGRFNEMR